MTGVTESPIRRRDALLRMKLGEISTWHLMAMCGACHKDRIVSVRSLIEHYGSGVTLLGLVPRFRCGVVTCRRPPVRLMLRNRFPVQPGPALVEVMLIDARGYPECPSGTSPRRSSDGDFLRFGAPNS
jgi:hypothetical protein